jgi:hypothetical protein
MSRSSSLPSYQLPLTSHFSQEEWPRYSPGRHAPYYGYRASKKNMECDAGARPLVCLAGDNLRSYLVRVFCVVQCRDSRSSGYAAGSSYAGSYQLGVSEQLAGPSRHDSSGNSAMALTEAKDRYSLFKKGITKLYDLTDVGQRLLAAQADLAQSPEERADVLQKQLEIYAEAEDNLQKQIKEGKAESADLDHLRYERLGVEIDLEVLRRGMAE